MGTSAEIPLSFGVGNILQSIGLVITVLIALYLKNLRDDVKELSVDKASKEEATKLERKLTDVAIAKANKEETDRLDKEIDKIGLKIAELHIDLAKKIDNTLCKERIAACKPVNCLKMNELEKTIRELDANIWDQLNYHSHTLIPKDSEVVRKRK